MKESYPDDPVFNKLNMLRIGQDNLTMADPRKVVNVLLTQFADLKQKAARRTITVTKYIKEILATNFNGNIFPVRKLSQPS